MNRGSIVLNNSTGRALRRGAVEVRARDVLDCTGEFAAGDTVYVTFRAVDGGQYAVATGVIGCNTAELRNKLASAEDAPVLRAEHIHLLW